MKRNKSNLSSMSGSEVSRERPIYRYMILIAVFVAVCVFYCVKIVLYNVHDETETPVEKQSRNTERIVTLSAVRGEIFDRNGKCLVKNRYSYDIIFEYSAMAKTYAGQNGDIIKFYEMIDELRLEDNMPAAISPLHGIYPYLSYDLEIMSGSLAESRHKRIISDLELPEDADIDALVNALCKKYRMINSKGEPLYSDREMTYLLRFRYETEAMQFSPDEPYVALKDVGMDALTRLKEMNIKGARISASYSREYCYPGYASHILGRISRIYAEDAEYYTSQGYPIKAMVGVDGCELAFEKYLRGMNGKMKIIEDEDGNVISTEIIEEPEAGNDVWLTLDIDLQMRAEQALADNVQYVAAAGAKNKNKYTGEDCDCGALVAQKTKTGEVLVVASYPTYDLSKFNETYAQILEDPRNPLFNRALEGTYAPGSTFKVGVATAALLERIPVKNAAGYTETFSPTTLIRTEGIYKYYSDYQPVCWLYTLNRRSHGNINVTSAIQVSCNCFFYEIGRILGIDTINKYCENYGLGQTTGIELRENTGVLGDQKYVKELGVVWTGGLTIQTAIGQAYSRFSPLQISSYISTIVNGGTHWSSHLLKEVRNFEGSVVFEPEPEVLSTVDIDTGTRDVIRNAMSKVVDENTSVTAFDGFPIKVGGKTGTAQVTGQSSNAVFVCFAPLDDPDITVSVVLERGATGANSARSARQVMDLYFLGQ